MFNLLLTTIFSVGLPPSGGACPDDIISEEYHLSDVCDNWLQASPAYAVTYRAALNPRPASQQVMLFQDGDSWFVLIAGYRWQSDEGVTTKRRRIAVSDSDAEAITSRMSVEYLSMLSALPYYGSDGAICLDGADVEIAMALDRHKYDARQHSCAGKTQINETANMFRNLALKYDPDFDGLLSGLAP